MQTLVRTKPFVDIILPNCNKAEFIEEAINSVIEQTYKNWHLYIIDDYSTDKSTEIIDKFSNSLLQYTYLVSIFLPNFNLLFLFKI